MIFGGLDDGHPIVIRAGRMPALQAGSEKRLFQVTGIRTGKLKVVVHSRTAATLLTASRHT